MTKVLRWIRQYSGDAFLSACLHGKINKSAYILILVDTNDHPIEIFW
jgi:hypothetical protein